MLDLIWDAIEALFDWGGDAIDTVAEVASNVDLGDVLLIGSAIYVTHLTVNSIKDELRNRQELKAKGATQVVIKDFINQSGYTEASRYLLNEGTLLFWAV